MSNMVATASFRRQSRHADIAAGTAIRVPAETAIRRAKMAEALGLTYREYQLEILERGRYLRAAPRRQVRGRSEIFCQILLHRSVVSVSTLETFSKTTA